MIVCIPYVIMLFILGITYFNLRDVLVLKSNVYFNQTSVFITLFFPFHAFGVGVFISKVYVV